MISSTDDEDEGDKENLKLSNDSNESDDEEEEVMAVAINDVDYDSEENEVVKTAGEFLDKEAELSESEWGSEDEDEQGLDVLDMEEADREKIDQRRLKRQLDEIHMSVYSCALFNNIFGIIVLHFTTINHGMSINTVVQLVWKHIINRILVGECTTVSLFIVQ